MYKKKLSEFACFAEKLVNTVGGIIRRAYNTPKSYIKKFDSSPVTHWDRLVERTISDAIFLKYPEHGVLGEEYGEYNTHSKWCWVIDPIDGTKAFIGGIPVFGVLVALTYDRLPVLGIIDNPISRDRWIGYDGEPTTLNGKVIHVSLPYTLFKT
jgi:inositol-phosphate phosphatase / L-galactose 1-phosphate phosphatase / histidinol-phosphatase